MIIIQYLDVKINQHASVSLNRTDFNFTVLGFDGRGISIRMKRNTISSMMFSPDRSVAAYPYIINMREGEGIKRISARMTRFKLEGDFFVMDLELESPEIRKN